MISLIRALGRPIKSRQNYNYFCVIPFNNLFTRVDSGLGLAGVHLLSFGGGQVFRKD